MIVAFLVVSGLMAMILALSRARIQTFLSSVTEISDLPTLERFKAMVRAEMWGAILVTPLSFAMIFLVIALNYYDGLLGVAAIFLVCGPLLFFSWSTKKLEIHAKSLPCCEDLNFEYVSVIEAWTKQLLPRF